MMARKGFILQTISILAGFLVAFACSSGDTTPDSGVTMGTGGTSGTVGTQTGGQSGQTTNTGGSMESGEGTTRINPGGGTGGTVTENPCGNGILDPAEICDGTLLDGASCQSLYGQEGDLACSPDCLNYVATGCYDPPPAAGGGGTTLEAGVPDGGGYGGV